MEAAFAWALNFSSLCSDFLECCSKAVHLSLTVAHCFQCPFQSRNSVFGGDHSGIRILERPWSWGWLTCTQPRLNRFQNERRSSCAANASGWSACHFALIHSLGSLADDQPELGFTRRRPQTPQRRTHKAHPTRTLREAITPVASAPTTGTNSASIANSCQRLHQGSRRLNLYGHSLSFIHHFVAVFPPVDV